MSNANPTAPNPVFNLSLTLPLSKEFLRGVQVIAMTAQPLGVLSWAHVVDIKHDQGPTYLIRCVEWDDIGLDAEPPEPLSVDLYTVQRGLAKAFDARFEHEIIVADRIHLVRAVLMQQVSPQVGAAVLAEQPLLLSRVVQLALFDQVIY